MDAAGSFETLVSI